MNERRSPMSCFIPAILFTVFAMLASGAYGASANRRDAWGPRYQDRPRFEQRAKPVSRLGLDAVRRWNAIALDANAFDHGIPASAGGPDQLGPLRTARAFAIVHIAIFDAANAIAGGYKSYTGIPPQRGEASVQAAIAQAAHATLVDLYPAQAATFDAELAAELAKIANSKAKQNGIDLGQRAAQAILALRAGEDLEIVDQLYGVEYKPDTVATSWIQDPISLIPIALGSRWDELVEPFVIKSASQFPIPAPPATGTRAFKAAFDEVKKYGGCGSDDVDCAVAYGGAPTPTERTLEQEQIGKYWGYDGTPRLGTPPRLYNQIAVQIAAQMGSSGVELARLLALVNLSMADAGLVAWKGKYDYEYARPTTLIRATDPTAPLWTPLGAPATNKFGPNFVPPFPAYASGHATFGAAMFHTLRNFYRTDRIAFSFVSDEYNGINKDISGAVRPLLPRSFKSLSQAEEENGQSRIYLGIHWAFDKTAGIEQGRQVADYVMKNVFTPVRGR